MDATITGLTVHLVGHVYAVVVVVASLMRGQTLGAAVAREFAALTARTDCSGTGCREIDIIHREQNMDHNGGWMIRQWPAVNAHKYAHNCSQSALRHGRPGQTNGTKRRHVTGIGGASQRAKRTRDYIAICCECRQRETAAHWRR